MPITGSYPAVLSAGLSTNSDFGLGSLRLFQSCQSAMHSLALYLTAFLATGSIFRDAAIPGVQAQSYLLGLGELARDSGV